MIFFNGTATTEIYALSLHDALPISGISHGHPQAPAPARRRHWPRGRARGGKGRRLVPQKRQDRKSTRLNSSHAHISYAVFCLKTSAIADEFSFQRQAGRRPGEENGR